MPNLYSLTTQELNVMKLIGQGNSNMEIADKLFISSHTVRAHMRSIYIKLSIPGDRVKLAIMACQPEVQKISIRMGREGMK